MNYELRFEAEIFMLHWSSSDLPVHSSIWFSAHQTQLFFIMTDWCATGQLWTDDMPFLLKNSVTLNLLGELWTVFRTRDLFAWFAIVFTIFIIICTQYCLSIIQVQFCLFRWVSKDTRGPGGQAHGSLSTWCLKTVLFLSQVCHFSASWSKDAKLRMSE